MIRLRRLFRVLWRLGLVTAVLGAVTVLAAYLYVRPELPSTAELRDMRMQVPLRVYTRDMRLIAEFGEVKRRPLVYDEIPPLFVKAILAAEDDRFFEHPGVDYQGILRAVVNLVATGEKSQGGSTITMQVARNFFLSRDKTYLRKLSEIFLALNIEHELSKREILTLYLNKIYLGNRAYGIAAAANVYYGTTVDRLTLPQIAMIAGLPKAPSAYNPIADRRRATLRRNYVLRRMHELGYIDDAAYEAARRSVDQARLHGLDIEVEADYVAEMARKYMVEHYGKAAYSGDYRVVTTIDSRLQKAARQAHCQALIDYDRRHGYRGAEDHVELTALENPGSWDGILRERYAVCGLEAAIVTAVTDDAAVLRLADGRAVELGPTAFEWARPFIDERHRGPKPRSPADVLTTGDIVRLQETDAGWRFAQLPDVEGALVSLDPDDGRILALVGGLDFRRSKFNRVVQAYRQPGSNFKPFLYSAALEKGYTPASLINDAPVVFDDPGLEDAWRPENYSGRFFGPTRLREALIHSRNLVSIRLLRAIGPDYVIDYASRFGFDRDRLPRNLSLALGSGVTTPLTLATAYSALANGGYKITPYLVERVYGPGERLSYQANPETVCTDDDGCPPTEPDGAGQDDSPPARPRARRIMTPENNYLMNSLLRDVIRRGTGRRARRLGRHDLAGKTGTTNDQKDAWFSGFNRDVVTVAWVGFDQVRSLGRRETGAKAALPMWMAYMKVALEGLPEHTLPRPPGLVTVRIDPKTGLLARSGQKHFLFETFRTANVPREYATPSQAERPPTPATGPATGGDAATTANDADDLPEQLF